MKRYLFVAVLFLSCFGAAAMGKDILDQSVIDAAKGKLVISSEYDLGGASLTLPEGFVLDFRGGSLDNGTLVGNSSVVKVRGNSPAFGVGIKISGTWNQPEVHDGWFAFDPSESFISNGIINNLLAFADDEHSNHIILEEDRVYHFEMPYKGRYDIGNMVSFNMVDGKKKRHYADIYNDEYSFLRIFTIPSNTRFTINNKMIMNPTGIGAYFVFWEFDKENVTIDGNGTISGDNYGHLYDSPYAGSKYFGEWGFIFRCIKCRNFVFKDVTLSDAFGDCVIYSGSYRAGDSGPRYSDGLLMDNVKILRARRNGVALGARNVKIQNCHFEGCGTEAVHGTNPQSAIDLEADGVSKFAEIGNENVVVDNCTFSGNYYDIHSYKNNLEPYGKMASVVRNCDFTGGLLVKGTYWLRFENCHIKTLTRTQTDVMWLSGSNHVEFVNCTIDSMSSEVKNLPTQKKNKFESCKIGKVVAK